MDVLDGDLIRAAIVDELQYFCSKVWRITSEAEAKADPNATLTGGRWILCNKGDADAPKVRARYVATEVNREQNPD